MCSNILLKILPKFFFWFETKMFSLKPGSRVPFTGQDSAALGSECMLAPAQVLVKQHLLFWPFG